MTAGDEATTFCPISRITNENDFVDAFWNSDCTVADMYPFLDNRSQQPPAMMNFTKTQLAQIIHEHMPRFGNTPDIAIFAAAQASSSSRSYYIGSRAMAILFWCFFLSWAIVLLLYARSSSRCGREGLTSTEQQKEMGNKASQEEQRCNECFWWLCDRSAAASHRSSALPPIGSLTSSEVYYDKHLPEERNVIARDKRGRTFGRQVQVRIIRIAFGLAVLGMLTSSIFVLIRFSKLHETTLDIRSNLSELSCLVQDAEFATRNFVYQQQKMDQARLDLVEYITERCTVMGYFNKATMQELKMSLSKKSLAFKENSYVDIQQSLERTHALMNAPLNGLTQAVWFGEYIVGTLLFVMDACGICFLIRTILTWRNESPRWLARLNVTILLPVFVALLSCTYMFSTYTLIYSIVTSDVCTETPNLQVVRILDHFRLESIEYQQLVGWYLDSDSTCATGHRPLFLLLDLIKSLDKIRQIDDALTLASENFLVPVSGLCSRESTSSELMNQLQDLDEPLRSLYRFLAGLECENYQPIYNRLAHHTCHLGIKKLFETYLASLPFCMFAMLIVTLQVALKDVAAPVKTNNNVRDQRQRGEIRSV